MSSQGVDMAGHGDTAVAFGVELKHHSDKPGLRLIDLQGGLAVHHSFVIAVWGVGHIAPVLDRHLEAAAQAFGDDLVLSAADEGFQLGVLLVDLQPQEHCADERGQRQQAQQGKDDFFNCRFFGMAHRSFLKSMRRRSSVSRASQR